MYRMNHNMTEAFQMCSTLSKRHNLPTFRVYKSSYGHQCFVHKIIKKQPLTDKRIGEDIVFIFNFFSTNFKMMQ